MNRIQKRRHSAIQKELLLVSRQEQKLERAALRAKPGAMKTAIESKIPPKVYTGIESAFCKGFTLVFGQGRAVIEKGIKKDDLQADHAIRDYAVQRKGTRKELKQMRRSAGQSNLLNLALTAAEGIGLGALGIGLPDIVLFLSNLLKGIYETALSYGFAYDTPEEQYLILAMMETALSSGEDWMRGNREVDALLHATVEPSKTDFDARLKSASAAFATDLLLLKFIQGLPLVGIIGGAANPVYYHRILQYVQLKYRKRYLTRLETTCR